VFQSNFQEGDINAPGGGHAMIVRTLPAYEDFEVLHPIFYYIYTDRVCFTDIPVAAASPSHNVPPCNPEDAYRLGDLYGLENLKEKALQFLLDTTDEFNIIPRILGEFALTYDAVGKAYEKMFYQYWNEIRKRSDLTEYFQKLHQGDDEKRKWEVTKRYVELTEGIERSEAPPALTQM
jgi:hypothetical protein